MHPAYSVIFFTTASGAGYGLLAVLAIAGAFGLVPPDRTLGIVSFGLAFALITAGLLSSTFHLGRPERAWRALSQWRSSWLSREGIAAIVTYGPAALTAYGWIVLGRADGLFAALGVVTALAAAATVYCTGQIYATLPTIRQWQQPLTTPVYLALALATGALIATCLFEFAGAPWGFTARLAFLALAGALALKLAYWRAIDRSKPAYTVEEATGLGHLGKVRPLDPPHSQANFVMREMGYAIARKHAERLRGFVIFALFAMPMALILISAAGPWPIPGMALFLAIAIAAAGVFVERWLFFAEAEHVSMLYYGRDKA
ncbi:MAG: DmsC/YnfH family molybdoenzyme membrane anchor subunit [Hyphomicrobiaceae bacterium]